MLFGSLTFVLGEATDYVMQLLNVVGWSVAWLVGWLVGVGSHCRVLANLVLDSMSD